MRVHHIAVLVPDLARAEAFYGGVLGLTVLARHTDAQGAPRSIWFALDGAFLAVELSSTPPHGAGGWHCVALAIEKIDREPWRLRLTAAGHPVERETAYTLYVRDPFGTLVALSHHPD